MDIFVAMSKYNLSLQYLWFTIQYEYQYIANKLE